MVMAGFLFATAALVVAAVLLLSLPLLRHRTRAGTRRYGLPLVLALGLPLATAGLYQMVGTPQAIRERIYAAPGALGSPSPSAAADNAPAPDPNAAEQAQWQALDAWMQQARTHERNDRPAQARDAYAQALKIAPDTSAAIVGWIAADMATRSDFAIHAGARTRLQQVVAREPDNQRGLWLLGISDFQQHAYAAATAHWRHLHGLLEDGSPMQQAVAEKIAVAESMARARQAAPAAR
ncbi:tetratricopeptide repeat protein [Xanthomonas melonis]|uniref:C-type cytochrome biogenesis protein n=1 Tax=Xanthomonas melonis TaxID=56456 RepID=A0A2S7DBS7_9XANT|nr:tetratricopeptide repeat protein [Xanthomonas melonis]MCC4601588.1 tetratricopeptide repeat protein [Xanthomonas melonis]PPU71285.1 C-type cytochrome biogenesis protein [Xanthomonas melonis]